MKTTSGNLFYVAIRSRTFLKSTYSFLWGIITIDVRSFPPIKNSENYVLYFIANDVAYFYPYFSWHEKNATTARSRTINQVHTTTNSSNITLIHNTITRTSNSLPILILNNNTTNIISSNPHGTLVEVPNAITLLLPHLLSFSYLSTRRPSSHSSARRLKTVRRYSLKA